MVLSTAFGFLESQSSRFFERFVRSKESVKDDIVSFTEKYKEYIRDLKNDGYVILGYCRKSKTRESKFTVTRSLQLMATGLRRRSLVQTLFVTVSCNASTSMHKRDTKKNKILQVLSVVAGNAQG
ncbi:hypothetical protein EDC94DRAFT_543558, partial [Helicostylum pulchrum]